ncbi:MAG: hypothetical protein ACP5N1_01685 [Candidatus Woesearchaeota archaeon]
MKLRYKKNKKGSWFVDNIGQLILMAIGIGVGIYFIWAYILHGGGGSLGELQKCGALTGNNGLCKETCDRSTELELPNVGCKGLANKCCVLKDDNINSLRLPEIYGGTENYRFSINSFEIRDVGVSGCVIKGPQRIDCNKGKEVILPIKIVVSNTGLKEVTVYAEPVIVIADNTNNIRYPVVNPKEPITIAGATYIAPSDAIIETTILIKEDDSKLEEAYLKIYPYVSCKTTECLKDGGDIRGIMTNDESQAITVAFI